VARLSHPSYEERLLVLGENGTGKSVLLRELLGSGYARSYSFDFKGDFEPIQAHTIVRKPDDRGWRDRHVVYRPRPEFRTPAHVEEVLWWLYNRAQRTYDEKRHHQREPFILLVDETYLFGRSHALASIAVAGRALGIGLWCGSQRPRNIPVPVRSEAHRIYLFPLGYTEDEVEALKYTKGQLTLEQLREGWENFSFWEIRRSRDSAGRRVVTHFPPVRPTP
jgi:GTPase SAR1 family protein